MEATKWLKPLVKKVLKRNLATMQAAT